VETGQNISIIALIVVEDVKNGNLMPRGMTEPVIFIHTHSYTETNKTLW
jgi:hypothetical protein